MPHSLSITQLFPALDRPVWKFLVRGLEHLLAIDWFNQWVHAALQKYDGNLDALIPQGASELNISINYSPDALNALPQTGPLIIIANHDNSLIDDVLLLAIAGKKYDTTTGKIKIIGTAAVQPIQGIEKYVIAKSSNRSERRHENSSAFTRAIQHLNQDGILIYFPISISAWRQGEMPGWALPCSKSPWILAKRTGAPIVPLFINIKTHWSVRWERTIKQCFLKLGFSGILNLEIIAALFILRNLKKFQNRTVDIVIGNPVPAPPAQIDGNTASAWVRDIIYALKPNIFSGSR